MQNVRTYLFILYILMSLMFPSGGKAQDILNGLVKITSVNTDGNEDTGSGILVGRFGEKVFIVTAYHVVENATPESIRVRLYASTGEDYPARLHYEINEELDLAVLIIEIPLASAIDFYKIRHANMNSLKVGDRVMLFGHPLGADWTKNDFNKIQDLRFRTYQLSISGIEIKPGFSGGPLTVGKKNRLIGMITDVKGSGGIALQIDEILQYLDKWLIPTNLVRPEPIKNSTFILSGVAGALFAGGMIFNDMGKENYQIYKNNQDESAYTDPESRLFKDVEGQSREEVFQQAKNQYMLRNIAYGLAGLSAATGIWLSAKKDPRKQRQMGNDEKLKYGFIYSTNGLQLALNVKF